MAPMQRRQIMLEKNNLQVAGVIAERLTRMIPARS
jgi:hypothetical protein